VRVRRTLGFALAALALCGCTDDPPPEMPAPPWDDDTTRLGHCAFEPAPVRAPQPPREPAPIEAGYGAAVLKMPIGTPLAAYGDRVIALGNANPPDERAARWATAMTPSVGTHDAMRAEAIAVAAEGDEPLLLMRVDAGFVTEGVLFELEKALADRGELRGRILLSASHSHAAFGAWMPTMHLAPGGDTPRRELLDRAVSAMREAAELALDDLQPARIGFAVESDFDPDDHVTRDRRKENDDVIGPDGNTAGKDKDPVAWVMRVDDAEGNAIAAVVNLAVHGTVGDGANPLAGTDAPGAIARAIEARVGYPVLHLQGVAGDVSPAADGGRESCPDATRCYDMPRLEVLGSRAADAMVPLIESVQTEAEAAFEMVTRSFPVGRGGVVTRQDGRELYYLPPDEEALPDYRLFDDDGFAASPFDEFNTVGGAGLCGAGSPTFAPLPGSVALDDPYDSCINLDTGAEVVLSIFEIPTPTLPECQSVRATGAALRVSGLTGGDWLLVGIPGEPTAPYAHYLRSLSPAGPERTLLVGYADEYSGYMLTAEDWLSGGYECSTNIWGPREGEQVLEALVEAAAIAWTPEIEDPEAGTTRFSDFEMPIEDAVEPTATSDHGTPVTDASALWWPDTAASVTPQPTATVARGVGVARFAWHGGDPAVDYPEVVVERMNGSAWEPLVDAGGRPASSLRGSVIITYAPSPLEATAPDSHLYAATWQAVPPDPYTGDALAPLSLAPGTYRLRATGRALAPSGDAEDYSVASEPFEVVAAELHSDASWTANGSDVEVVALIGPAPGMRALREGASPSDGVLSLPGPSWTLTITLDDATTLEETVSPDSNGRATLTLDPATVAQIASVEVRDPVGNGGMLPSTTM
jgi:neutral ceramidase